MRKLKKFLDRTPLFRENLYIVGVVSFITVNILMSYFVYSDAMDIMPLRAVRYLILASMIFKILVFDLKSYSKKRLWVTVAIFLAILVASIFSENRNLLWVFIMIVAAYGTDFRRVLKYVLICELVIVGLFVLLFLLGITPDRIYGRSENDVMRHSLGFRYATYLGIFLFSIACGWFYLRWKKARWYEFLGFLLLALLSFLLTDTRFEPICIVLVVSYFGLRRVWPRLKYGKILAFLAKYIVFIVAIVSIVAVYTYDKESPIMSKLNDVSSGRLSLMSKAEREYPESIFGRPIKWVGISEVYNGEVESSEFNAVDNVYVRLMLNYGIIVLGIFLAMQYLLGKKAVEDKNEELQFILIVIACYSMLSPRMIELTFNYFLMLYPTIGLTKLGGGQKHAQK